MPDIHGAPEDLADPWQHHSFCRGDMYVERAASVSVSKDWEAHCTIFSRNARIFAVYEQPLLSWLPEWPSMADAWLQMHNTVRCGSTILRNTDVKSAL